MNELEPLSRDRLAEMLGSDARLAWTQLEGDHQSTLLDWIMKPRREKERHRRLGEVDRVLRTGVDSVGNYSSDINSAAGRLPY